MRSDELLKSLHILVVYVLNFIFLEVVLFHFFI
jgi:hypothetical protein